MPSAFRFHEHMPVCANCRHWDQVIDRQQIGRCRIASGVDTETRDRWRVSEYYAHMTSDTSSCSLMETKQVNINAEIAWWLYRAMLAHIEGREDAYLLRKSRAEILMESRGDRSGTEDPRAWVMGMLGRNK